MEALWAVHEELRLLRRSFETLFCSRGWYAHDDMRVVTMWAAVDLGRRGEKAKADEALAAALSLADVRADAENLAMMAAFHAHRERVERALRGYENDDFAGTVQAVAAIIARSAPAWDAISTEDRSLSLLRERLPGASREKVTSIDAAKAWSALFATRDWLVRSGSRVRTV